MNTEAIRARCEAATLSESENALVNNVRESVSEEDGRPFRRVHRTVLITLTDIIARLTTALADMTAAYHGMLTENHRLNQEVSTALARRDLYDGIALNWERRFNKATLHTMNARRRRDAIAAERDALRAENDALTQARQFYEADRDAWRKRAEKAEKFIQQKFRCNECIHAGETLRDCLYWTDCQVTARNFQWRGTTDGGEGRR